MSEDVKNIKCCSFCGKSQHEAKKLIAGPNVFICDSCITLCTNTTASGVISAYITYFFISG